jgi:hypothetical protein
MLRRLLPVVLLVVVACVAALAVALRSDDQTPSPPTAAAIASTLGHTGDGPAGSAIVTLTRWRYRDDPGDRGLGAGWRRGTFGGRVVRVPYSPNANAYSGRAGALAHAGSIGWFARNVDAPVGGR